MGKDIRISLDVDIENHASWTRTRNVMKKLLAEQETWDKSCGRWPPKSSPLRANEWLADNDQTDRNPEQAPITEEEFARRILLTEFLRLPRRPVYRLV